MSTITIRAGEKSPQVDEIKHYLQKSLFFLCTQFLNYKDWDAVHDDMEILLRKPSRRKACVIPRNHLKSTFGTIAFSIQNIIKNPNIRILIANQVWDMSRTFLREIKEQLENSQLKYLFGDFVSAKWNEDEIIVKQRWKPLKEPTIRTAGIESEQTGGHYDLIILDDLMGLQNSQTPEQREKAKRFRRSMINLLEPGGMVVENLTRWHLDDTFAEILEKELKYYDVMVREVVENGKLIFPKKFSRKFDPSRKDWVSTYEISDENDKAISRINMGTERDALEFAQKKYGKKASVKNVSDPTCMDYIDHLKASMPIDEFSAQYLNRPFSSENLLFKPEMFRYWNQRPQGLFTVLSIDLASSDATWTDETALVVTGMDKSYQIYVLDYLTGRWNPSDVVLKIAEMRTKWHPHTVAMETNGFQNTYKLACESHMRKTRDYYTIQEVRNGPTKSKFERMKTLEPFYRDGRVFHATWMKRKDLENQLSVITMTGTKGKHDDLPDALSMALPHLYPGVALSQEPDKEWTWDWCVKMAQQNSRPLQGFFEYGR